MAKCYVRACAQAETATSMHMALRFWPISSFLLLACRPPYHIEWPSRPRATNRDVPRRARSTGSVSITSRRSAHRPPACGEGEGLPRFVEQVFRDFLRCGWLAGGFARFRCVACGAEWLVPFSCKRHGFCPSCGGRRMAGRAAHLVDDIFPDVAVRQWPLSTASRTSLLAADRRLLLRDSQPGCNVLCVMGAGLWGRATGAERPRTPFCRPIVSARTRCRPPPALRFAAQRAR